MIILKGLGIIGILWVVVCLLAFFGFIAFCIVGAIVMYAAS